MTVAEVPDILRAQGHAAGAPDDDKGTVRIWVHGGDHSVDVHLGRNLIHLA